MLVTLMTDASLCLKTGMAGFGFWCVSDRGKLAGGNTLKGIIKDSHEAEMKGVANSLHITIKEKLILDGDVVLIQLDNLGVIGCIQGKHKVRADLDLVIKHIRHLSKKHKLKILCRHVKGHSNEKENRFAANNYCDIKAKTNMKLARSNFKGRN